jgi:hypothetical protein
LIWIDVLVTTQAHLAIGVDGDGGCGLEHLARVGRGGRDVLGAIRVAVWLDGDGVLLLDDGDFAERGGDASELDVTEIGDRLVRRERDLLRLRREAEEGDAHRVGAWPESLHAERARRAGDRAGDECTAGLRPHRDRSTRHGRAALLINDGPFDLSVA